MQWWAWIAIGVILLGSELAFVDAQFYLVFIGAAALLVGSLAVGGVSLLVWQQWLLFSVVCVVLLLGFRSRIYKKLRPDLPVVKSGLAGETLLVPVALAVGDECRLEFRGSTWRAVNGGPTVITAGASAHIERVDGLTLVLRP